VRRPKRRPRFVARRWTACCHHPTGMCAILGSTGAATGDSTGRMVERPRGLDRQGIGQRCPGGRLLPWDSSRRRPRLPRKAGVCFACAARAISVRRCRRIVREADAWSRAGCCSQGDPVMSHPRDFHPDRPSSSN
jgi:hypothetical protein